MNATTPPRAWASARTCWQTVVLPDDSGPKISVIRPRGMPPTPSARSRAMEPVGMKSTACRSVRAELHDRAATELLLDRRDRRVDGLAALRRGPLRRPVRCPLVRHRHPFVTLLSTAIVPSTDRIAVRPAPIRLRPFPRRRPPRLAHLADHLHVLRGVHQRRQLGWPDFSFGFFLASLLGRSREPIDRLRVVLQLPADLHADFSATSPPLIRPARRRRSGMSRGTSRPGSRFGS